MIVKFLFFVAQFVLPMTTLHFGISDFKPSNDDEISLSLNDSVSILESFEDGWAMSINNTTGETGLLPLNFLVKVNVKDDTIDNKQGTIEEEVDLNDRQDESPDDISSQNYSDIIKFDYAQSSDEEEDSVSRAISRLTDINIATPQLKPDQVRNFKILICGDSGIGKTEFIKMLTKYCTSDKTEPTIRKSITETRINGSQIPRSGYKSNIKLLDTIGFGDSIDASSTIDPILTYMQKQFKSTDNIFSKSIQDYQILKIIESGGHDHVDICVYGILHRIKPIDIEFLKKLSVWVPIVPVILKSDTLNENQVFLLKERIIDELEANGIICYSFGLTYNECKLLSQSKVIGAIPFAVSNIDLPNRINEFSVLASKCFSFNTEIKAECGVNFMKWRESNKPIVNTARDKTLSPPPSSSRTYTPNYESLSRKDLPPMLWQNDRSNSTSPAPISPRYNTRKESTISIIENRRPSVLQTIEDLDKGFLSNSRKVSPSLNSSDESSFDSLDKIRNVAELEGGFIGRSYSSRPSLLGLNNEKENGESLGVEKKVTKWFKKSVIKGKEKKDKGDREKDAIIVSDSLAFL